MIRNIFKGFIIGIAKIMPGVSGSMLAISLNVYERLLGIIADIRHITKEKFKFLFAIVFGALIGISLLSGSIKWLLNSFYFPIMLLFIGLITGGLPELLVVLKNKWRCIRNVIIFILSFTFSYILANLGTVNVLASNNVLMYFGLGLIEAFSSIIPGISGTAIYMSLGVYETILDFFSNIFNPAYFKFGIFFTVGLFLGIIIIAKTITYLLKKYKVETYYAIFGFMIASIFIMFKESFSDIFNKPIDGLTILEMVCGFIFLYVGYKLTVKINSLLAKK